MFEDNCYVLNNKYKLVKEIGRGGSSTVFYGEQQGGSAVAVKLVFSSYKKKDPTLQAVVSEISMLSSLHHQ
jgi:serine/threonine protein kinase